MPIFRCEVCGCVENTATSNYHIRNTDILAEEYRGKLLCSEHSPATYRSGNPNPKGGAWHNKFPKISSAGFYLDSSGYLWEKPHSPFGKILGKYLEDGSVEPFSPEQTTTPTN